MIKELLRASEELPLGGEKESKRLGVKAMGQEPEPELSLGPLLSIVSESMNSSPSESDANNRRKRKQCWDEPKIQTSIDLQLNDPLPLDWEQCLDLQCGRMYYLNRKTRKKSWIWPKEQKLDLELNISSFPSSEMKVNSVSPEEPKKLCNSSGNMVAVACVNCHLLVMLCRSSPSCPNCKYLNSLPSPTKASTPRKIETVKSLETLSLLH